MAKTSGGGARGGLSGAFSRVQVGSPDRLKNIDGGSLLNLASRLNFDASRLRGAATTEARRQRRDVSAVLNAVNDEIRRRERLLSSGQRQVF